MVNSGEKENTPCDGCFILKFMYNTTYRKFMLLAVMNVVS